MTPIHPGTRNDAVMTLHMNPGWEGVISDIAVKAVEERFQPILDSVFDEYAGQSLEVIKPVLAQRWAAGNENASITDPELTSIAQAISDGRRVVLTNGGPMTA